MSSYCSYRSSSLIDTENKIHDPELQTKETTNSPNALPFDIFLLTITQSLSRTTSSSVTGNLTKQTILELSLNNIYSFSS